MGASEVNARPLHRRSGSQLSHQPLRVRKSAGLAPSSGSPRPAGPEASGPAFPRVRACRLVSVVDGPCCPRGWEVRGGLGGGSRSRGPAGSAVSGPGPAQCPGGLAAREPGGAPGVAAAISGACPGWLVPVTGVISPRGRLSRTWRQMRHVRGGSR